MDRSKEKKPIEPYYSSDEEIAWGPRGLREIKWDLTKQSPRKIKRRETNLGLKSYDYRTLKETCDNPKSENANNNSTMSSEYFSAKESIKNDSSNNFLDKLSEVIEAPPTVDQSLLLDNVGMTLVENTIIISSDEESVIELSDDDYSYLKEIKRETSLSDCSKQLENVNINEPQSSSSYSAEEYTTTNESMSDCSKKSKDECIEDQDDLTDGEDNFMNMDCIEIDGRLSQDNIIHYEHSHNSELDDINSDLIEERYSSPIEINVNMDQFDQSDFSLESGFNDTLEEMEMALKYGINDTSIDSKESDPVSLPLHSQEDVKHDVPKFTGFKIPSITPSKIPVSSTKLKVPQKCTDKFKDIVSPVRVYINNTAKMCLKQNIPDRKISKLNIGKTPEKLTGCSNKENFPEIVYKPAKLIQKTTLSDIKLPTNIKKFVPQVTCVKHENRIIGRNMEESDVQRKLLLGNLTALDNSLFDQDISIITSRTGYIH